jgi:outer membrane protein assembly factor BamD (BamD/ComL family)
MGAAADPLAVEVDLVRRAHAALQDGDPARALKLLDQHAAAFPNGALAEERSVARIKALCLLGRSPEARSAAQQFRRQTPRSQYLRTVEASCGGSAKIE